MVLTFQYPINGCNRVLTFQNVCQAIAGILTMSCVAGVFYFWIHSHMMAENLSSPSIMILGRTQKGEPIMIDDFRYAYYKANET